MCERSGCKAFFRRIPYEIFRFCFLCLLLLRVEKFLVSTAAAFAAAGFIERLQQKRCRGVG